MALDVAAGLLLVRTISNISVFGLLLFAETEYWDIPPYIGVSVADTPAGFMPEPARVSIVAAFLGRNEPIAPQTVKWPRPIDSHKWLVADHSPARDDRHPFLKRAKGRLARGDTRA